jgi:hypothetical protein
MVLDGTLLNKKIKMYKKITHNIVEEHFDHPAVMPVSMRPPQRLSKPKENEEDVIKLNVPLMIRLLEWAREDANKDVELHIVAEKLIELCEEGDTLEMSDYPEIIVQEEND